MTELWHTPIAAGAEAKAATFNLPLSQLDTKITELSDGMAGAGIAPPVIFTVEGEVEVKTLPLAIYNLSGSIRRITKVFLNVGSAADAPAGTANANGGVLVVDVIGNNDVSIFSAQDYHPFLADGSITGSTSQYMVPYSWAPNTKLQCVIEQVGDETPGSNLTISIVYDYP
jgi:hypothetical protein